MSPFDDSQFIWISAARSGTRDVRKQYPTSAIDPSAAVEELLNSMKNWKPKTL